MKPDRRVLLWTAELLEQLSRDGTPVRRQTRSQGSRSVRQSSRSDSGYTNVGLLDLEVTGDAHVLR